MMDLFSRDKWLADRDASELFVCHQEGGAGGPGGTGASEAEQAYAWTGTVPVDVVVTSQTGTGNPGPGAGWDSAAGVAGSGEAGGLGSGYGAGISPGGFGTSTGGDFAGRFAGESYNPSTANPFGLWGKEGALNSRFGFPNDIAAPRGVYNINPNRMGNPYGPGLSPAFVQSLQPPTRGDFPPPTRGEEPPARPPPTRGEERPARPPPTPVTPTVRGTTPTPTPAVPVADPRSTTPHGPADRGADESYAVNTYGQGGDVRVRNLNMEYGQSGQPENIREYPAAIYNQLASDPRYFAHIREQGLLPEDIANEIQRPMANLGIGRFDSPETASAMMQLQFGEGYTPDRLASDVLGGHGIDMETGGTFGAPITMDARTAANMQMGELARGPWSGFEG